LPPSTQSNPRVTIASTRVWSQADPILDILLANPDSEMLVLGLNSIADYRLTDGKWTPVSTASLVLPRPMPRDPRGRIEATPEGFRAYLPVATCDGAMEPELKVTCSDKVETWQNAAVRWVTDRNVVQSGAPAPTFEGWGNDSAAIADPCGSGQAIMADSPSNDHDSVRAYQIADGRATPVSAPAPLPGPVTALWPAASGREAIVVVRNLQTGEYEASRLVVACSQ
jgi:hypothetical protein